MSLIIGFRNINNQSQFISKILNCFFEGLRFGFSLQILWV